MGTEPILIPDGLPDDMPDTGVNAVCLRVRTLDDAIKHWHFTKDGEWVPMAGNHG
jgi:hypothetical protein